MTYLYKSPEKQTKTDNKAKTIVELMANDIPDIADYYPPFAWIRPDDKSHPHHTRWAIAQRYGLDDYNLLTEEKVPNVGTRYWLPQKSEYTVTIDPDMGIENHESTWGLARYYFGDNGSSKTAKVDYTSALKKMTDNK